MGVPSGSDVAGAAVAVDAVDLLLDSDGESSSDRRRNVRRRACAAGITKGAIGDPL